MGLTEPEVDESMSRRWQGQWIENQEAACRQWVAERLWSELEQGILGVIRARAGGRSLRPIRPPSRRCCTSTILAPTGAGVPYVRRAVRLGLCSLTDRRPVCQWLAKVLLGPLAGMACDVVALDVGRAFWGKATILHAEHHRDAASPMPGNYSRHYADVRPWPRDTKLGTRCRMSRCWGGW